MKHSIFRPTLFASAAAIMAAIACPAQAEDYFFGDSDLEQGNFQLLAGLTEEDLTPYYCEDGLCRSSNGPVWVEHLSPGVVAALATSKLDGPLNFGVSGAHMTALGDPAIAAPTGVVAQIALFGALVQSSKITVTASDRFFVHAGPNDLERLLAGEDPDILAQQVVGAALENVNVLSGLGAKTIVISNVQPVDLIPLLRASELQPLRESVGAFVGELNAALAGELTTLAARLPDDTNLILVDHAAFLGHLSRDYRDLGFTSFDEPCWNVETGEICATDRAGQNAHAFFDDNHYSAATHALLADWYAATLSAADGTAALDAGQMPVALLASAQAMSRESQGAQRLAEAAGLPFAIFAAPIINNGTAENGLSLRQRGGLGGVRYESAAGIFGSVSAAYLEQEVRTASDGAFTTSEWSVEARAGYARNGLELSLEGSYSRPKVQGFVRQTGALGLAAKGRTSAGRYSAALAVNDKTRFDCVVLDWSGRFEYRRVEVDGFDESGADGLALAYRDQRASDLTFANVARLAVELAEPDADWSLQPFVRFRDRRRLAGGTHDVVSRLIDNTANPASLTVDDLNSNATAIGGGVAFGFDAGGTALRLEAGYLRQIKGPFDEDGRYTVALSMAF